MAGAGYKLFSTGDVLSASDVNTYLQQQTVMVFASAAARTTALASVLAEGMVTYLKDTDVVEIYTGAAWVSLDDPNAIQNALLTAKGSIVTATAASTPSALAVGANNTVLTADSTTATGLKWATPATSSQKIIQVVTGTYSTNFSTTSTSPVDTGLSVSITPTLSTSTIAIWHNGNYYMNAGATSAINIRILRGATAIKTYNSQFYDNNNDLMRGEISLIYVDSPATTSATTYKIQIWNDIANTIGAQYNNEESRFILMEVGA